MQTTVIMTGGLAMSATTMSGLNGVLAGLAVCGLTRMVVVERGEAKATEVTMLVPAG